MKNYEEMAREVEALKDTEQEFEGLVPVKARVAKNVRSVFSLRIGAKELDLISAAARSADKDVGAFIRDAALAAARGEIGPETLAQAKALRTAREAIERALAALDVR